MVIMCRKVRKITSRIFMDKAEKYQLKTRNGSAIIERMRTFLRNTAFCRNSHEDHYKFYVVNNTSHTFIFLTT